MQTLTELLIDQDYKNRILSDTQLARLVGGTPQRRHNLVNRALKAHELIRIRRGHYVLATKYRDYPVHPFALAQAFVPGSYISLETALAWHGWIPEAVFTTASITPGRKSLTTEHPEWGRFSFHPLALRQGCFLERVERIQIEGQTMLVAKPVRALMDLVCLRKVEWQGMAWLTEGLRIEEESLGTIKREDIDLLMQVYQQKRVRVFLAALADGLSLTTEVVND